ncbi:hypothetical protein Dimus_007750 [Dionaea muscipula]
MAGVTTFDNVVPLVKKNLEVLSSLSWINAASSQLGTAKGCCLVLLLKMPPRDAAQLGAAKEMPHRNSAFLYCEVPPPFYLRGAAPPE